MTTEEERKKRYQDHVEADQWLRNLKPRQKELREQLAMRKSFIPKQGGIDKITQQTDQIEEELARVEAQITKYQAILDRPLGDDAA